MSTIQKLVRFARKSRREQLHSVRYHLADWRAPHLGSDRTAYIVGLLGTGRTYIKDLVLQNIGDRADYFREYIRFHQGPTSMIYCGHAAIRHLSLGLALPLVTSRLLEGMRLGFADLIFVYRHPLDSLLTNWVFWRTMFRDNRLAFSISHVYKSTDEFCADLEQNFQDFNSFAERRPVPWAFWRAQQFLSFSEFVEETELFLEAATLSLRLEDFMIDPLKEFSKLAEVMSVKLDPSRLHIAAPRSKPYGFLAVKQQVPQFSDFIDGLDVPTRRRIEKMGYHLDV
jgi:hypothetical protein